MLSYNNEKKENVNILLNVDNFYGRYSGGNGRALVFVIAVSIPFLIYAVALMSFIPFKFFFPVYLFYALRVGMLTIGREKERVESYLKQKNDEYAVAKDLAQFFAVHDDGMIEYVGGKIVYIIQAYGHSYYSDDAFARELEEFLDSVMSKYETDIYGFLVYKELDTTRDDLEKLSVYVDPEMQQERLDFYKLEDKTVNDKTKLYQLNFAVKANKSEWNKLRNFVFTISNSELTRCFNTIKVCNKQEAIDVMSRDATVYVDVGEMLNSKHLSEEFHGSKVLYFGDDVPDRYKPKVETFDNEVGRRIFDKIDS